MPVTASLAVTCTLLALARDVGEANTTDSQPVPAHDTIDPLCVAENGKQYMLTDDKATQRWVNLFEWGTTIAATLVPVAWEIDVAYSITDASLAPGHTPARRPRVRSLGLDPTTPLHSPLPLAVRLL